jgi:hypothetical protein
VDKHDVGAPAATGIERLAGPLCDHFHIDARLGFEQGQYVPEQAGVLRRGGRRDNNRFFPSVTNGDADETTCERGKDGKVAKAFRRPYARPLLSGPEQEDLRDDRGMAQSSDRGRSPVCLSRCA